MQKKFKYPMNVVAKDSISGFQGIDYETLIRCEILNLGENKLCTR